jgi:ATP-dependent DNA ligase
MLESLVEGQRLLLPVRWLAGSGLEAWAEVERRGYEGLVAKDESSLYTGGRTLSWLKVKQPEYRAGNREGAGSSAGSGSDSG